MAINTNPRWDLSVENRNGQLALVVEVKRNTNVSPEWAAKFRRNILAHGISSDAPYCLLAFPDTFYLWTDSATHLDQSEPAYTIDARPLLQPYFELVRVTADKISEASLELIVATWLGEIIYSEELPENMHSSQRWLIESGLYAALAGGRFIYEAAA